MRTKIRSPAVLLVALALLVGLSAAGALAENIDPFNDSSQYAWSENTGWINAEPANCSDCGVEVTDTALSGYMWGENKGWINMSCTNNATCGTVSYGVTNDGAGNLAGYAWSENAGWMSFSCANTASCGTVSYGVTIDPLTGIFSGYAWGENDGWMSFNCSNTATCGSVDYKVQAAWCPSAVPNTDSTGIPNGTDIVNAFRANPDKDSAGNGCDPDDDNDGPDANDGLYTDGEEAAGCGAFAPTDPLVKDSDGDTAIDGNECREGTDPNNPADRPFCVSATDTDGDGISDCVEELGYGTSPTSIDTDGDSGGANNGCRDDKQIVDVNGDGQANILDVFPIATIALVTGVYDPVSEAVADINKDGANNILDVFIGASNSTLVEAHAVC